MPTSAPADTARRAALFHALSDKTRLEILRCLSSCEQCVCDLTSTLGAGQSRLSFHIKVLKDAGLISDRREGRWNYYTLTPEVLEEAAQLIDELRHPGSACGTAETGCC